MTIVLETNNNISLPPKILTSFSLLEELMKYAVKLTFNFPHVISIVNNILSYAITTLSLYIHRCEETKKEF
jgi:hypothetical protein